MSIDKAAAGYLRPDEPNTVTEQAALDHLAARRWVLWHADDRDQAIVRLLDRAGLIRDREHEKQKDQADAAGQHLAERDRAAGKRYLGRTLEMAALAIKALRDGAH